MMAKQQPIIVEQIFKQPTSKVWQALTEPEQMRHWFFDNIPDFQPEEGFQTEFNVKTPEREFLHQWTIIEVEDGRKIVYDWQYKGYPGQGTVTFELFETEAGTRLRLTAENMESFPQNIPEFTRESCRQGWEYFIQNQLRSYLDNNV